MANDLRGFYLHKAEIVVVPFEDRLQFAVIVNITDGAIDVELMGPSFLTPLAYKFLHPNTQCYLVFDHTNVPMELLYRAQQIRGFSGTITTHIDAKDYGETQPDDETQPYESE